MSYIAKWLLKLLGWTYSGGIPNIDKCVIIVAPHTSNWDFVLGISLKLALKLDLSYLGKNSLFKWYSGWFFKGLGGIPVDRVSHQNIVEQVVQKFDISSRLWLALSPEGTRTKINYWRSGFYHIALAANVPIVTVYIDATTKSLGFGPIVKLTGDVDKDMAIFRDFFNTKTGICPEKTNPVRLKQQLLHMDENNKDQS